VKVIINYFIVLGISLKFLFIECFLLVIQRFIHSNKYTKNSKPLVSIIIATFNRGDILVSRTVPHLLAQDYKNIEIIVVGDKCKDDTPNLIKKISDNRVRFYDLKVRGKYPKSIVDRWFVQGAKPRNMGMKYAKGDWFVWMSDDDILYPNHVNTLLDYALSNDLEFVSANYEEERDGKKNIIKAQAFDKNHPSFLVGGMPTWMYRSYLKSFKWNIHSWRKDYNRPVDFDLVSRFRSCGVRMGHTDTVVTSIPPVEGTNTVGYQAALVADKD
jgi:glycosyltransferase involved in cell wall biosynthesis